jgi:hypothetical protein
MQRLAAILLAAATVGLSFAGELSGIHMPPYPEGLVQHDGSCIRMDQRLESSCPYEFGILEDGARIPRVIYVARLEGRDSSGKPKWVVLDSFRVPKLPVGYRVALAECSKNGTVDATIVAVVRRDNYKGWLDAVLIAKRFDLAKGTFSDLSLKGVRCKNVGMG